MFNFLTIGMALTIMLTVIIRRLCVLVAVAYITLLERKILRYLQFRKGPNKVGILGIAQPLADALKLFTKEVIVPFRSNNILFIVIPIVGFTLALTF